MIYFDHSATSPPYEEVVDTVATVMKKYVGNPSSLHRLGVEAERLLKESRERIAQLLNMKSAQIIFTSGGTEANNLAIKGTMETYRNRGNHIITTAIEHPSVYECVKQLEQRGCEVTWIPVDDRGIVQAEKIEQAIRPETVLVSVMHVNNEVGSIQPIEQIGQMLTAHRRILFHVDAVQSIGKLPIDFDRWGIDLLTASAHKFKGPRGTGFLACRDGIRLEPLLAGGGQEFGMRSGTENVALIVGMTRALRMSLEHAEAHKNNLWMLRQRLIERLRSFEEITVHGADDERWAAPHIVNFSIAGLRSEVVVHALEEEGVYVSTRSACSSGDMKPSRTLLAMGVDEEQAQSGIRLSFSFETTNDEIERFLHILKNVIIRLKAAVQKGRGSHE